METKLIAMPIKDFIEQKKFKQIVPVIRANVNGYPYLTFIDADNIAENVYFSKSAAKALEAGQPVTKEMLKVYQIGLTKNEAGEERIKLITNSERVELADLLG